MGIHCEINLHKPSNDVLVGIAGSVVSGIIKYAVDKETDFSKIIVSLKGLGALRIVENYGSRHSITHTKSETYIDIDNVIQDDEKGNTLIGAYEIPFRFEIPYNLPQSVTFNKFVRNYRVKCRIKYYVRIKFNRCGIMNFTKRFKKAISVVSCIIPRLSITPIIYGGQKNLMHLFSCNSSCASIKATILKSVLKCGDTVEIHYNLTNNTTLAIKGVETKLVEIHKFYIKAGKEMVKHYVDVLGTDSKTSVVKSGETQEMLVEMNIPLVPQSAEFSKIYSREYCVLITVLLPLPHKNYVLKIPIQIGHAITDIALEACSYDNVDPPSYWESMKEYKFDTIQLD